MPEFTSQQREAMRPAFLQAATSVKFQNLSQQLSKALLDLLVTCTTDAEQYADPEAFAGLDEAEIMYVLRRTRDELIASALAGAAASVLMSDGNQGRAALEPSLHRLQHFAQKAAGMMLAMDAEQAPVQEYGARKN